MKSSRPQHDRVQSKTRRCSTGSRRRNNSRRHGIERLEPRRLLAADLHNDAMPADVNLSGDVTAIDALMIINELGRGRSGTAREQAVLVDEDVNLPSPRYDVSNDQRVSSLDALLVINELARAGSAPAAATVNVAAGVDTPAVVQANFSTGSADWLFDLDTDPDVEADRSFGLVDDFGPDSVFLSKDWNDDGQDDMIVVRKDRNVGLWQWFVATNADPSKDDDPVADIVFHFGLIDDPLTGRPADIPVAGDWDGAGGANAGVARPEGGFLNWFITVDDNSTSEIGPVLFGLDGDTPVTGDWDGDGRDKIGVARREDTATNWYLDINGNGGFEPGEGPFAFGLNQANDIPVPGDWDGDGIDDLGIARKTAATGLVEWFRNTDRNDPFAILPTFQFGLNTHDVIVAGSWTKKPEFQLRDLNGNEISNGQRLPDFSFDGGLSAVQTFSIRNTGNQPLNLTQPFPLPSTPNGFIVENFPRDPLAPDQSADFTIRLDPAFDGLAEGIIVITSNDGNELAVVLHAREAAPEIEVVLTPELERFANGSQYPFPESALVGETIRLQGQVRNTGTGTLDLSQLLIDGPFQLDSGTFPTMVPPGGVQGFTIVMDTSTVGEKRGFIEFRSDDADEPAYRINLFGNVVAETPALTASRPNGGTLDFKTITQSSRTKTLLIQIENVGGADLDITSVSDGGPDFFVDYGGILLATIPRNGRAFIAVTIDASSPGPKSGVLVIKSNDPGGDYTINLAGTVDESVEPDPIEPQLTIVEAANGATLLLGSRQQNEIATFPLKLTNSGGGTVVVQSITPTGDFTFPSSLNPGFPLTLTAGQERTIQVRMKTDDVGPTSGTLRVSTVGSSTPYIVNLSGNVTEAPVQIMEQHLFSLAQARTLRSTTTGENVLAQPNDIVRVTRFINDEYEFEIVLDGSESGLSDNRPQDNIDAFTWRNGRFYLSTSGTVNVPGLTFQKNDIVSYTPSTGRWDPVYDGGTGAMGIGDNNIDALDILPGNRSFLVSLSDNGQAPLAGGNGPVKDSDVLTLFPETGVFAIRESFPGDIDAVSRESDLHISSQSQISLSPPPNPYSAAPVDVSVRGGSRSWQRAFDGASFGISGQLDGYQTLPLFGALEIPPGDYSDAPATYPTAIHFADPDGPRLGSLVDFETADQASMDAGGDDNGLYFTDQTSGGVASSDEDGLLSVDLSPGSVGTLQVEIGGPQGVLDAWIDFNADGDWFDAGEHVVVNRAVFAGEEILSFDVPADAIVGPTFARLRISRSGTASPSEDAFDGEVEDHLVGIAASPTTTFTVTSTADSGAGSLRQAILDANASLGPATIAFAIPPSDPGFVDVDATIAGGDAQPDVYRISPLTALPAINNAAGLPVIIDATTQTVSGGDSNSFGPEIELDGSLSANEAHGLILDGNQIQVRGLVVNDFGFTGMLIRGGSIVVAGNYVGTDATGTVAQPNRGLGGIEVFAASDVTIGGPNPSDRNLLSGNSRDGLLVRSASENVTLTNSFIGTDRTGTSAVANGFTGVAIDSGTNVFIGDNLISGNARTGIFLRDATMVSITANRIGTDISGDNAVPNINGGVEILGSSGISIGGSAPEAGNLISGNTGTGVTLTESSDITIASNTVGLNHSGNAVPNGALNGDSTGIRLLASTNNVRIGLPGAGNVISGNSGSFARGIAGDGPNLSNIQIVDNFIGTDATGSFAIGNEDGGIDFGGNDLTITGNVVSGNSAYGVAIYDSVGLTFQGNRIGTNAAGDAAVANAHEGVKLINVRDAVIGGSAAGQANVISGNLREGLEVRTGSRDIAIKGNRVGTNAAGTAAIGNSEDGIVLDHAFDVSVGGPNTTDANLISGNGEIGIFVVDGLGNQIIGNQIGTDATGTLPIGNAAGIAVIGLSTTIVDNVIAANSSDGIRFLLSEYRPKIVPWPVDAGGNGHFYVQTPILSWEDAQAFAGALGGHLVTIDDAVENQFLVDNVDISTGPWIGFNDAAVEGDFQWVSAATGNYTNWNVNEPNGGLRENYGTIQPSGGWNDLPNWFTRVGIIEFNFEPSLDAIRDAVAPSIVAGNQIGGSSPTDAVLGNGETGIFVFQSEKIVVGGSGDAANQILGNASSGVTILGDKSQVTVLENSISGGEIGIDLGANGVTPNDVGDVDTGPNGLLNTPVIEAASPSTDGSVIVGSLQSEASSTFTIHLYENSSGTNRQAERFLTTVNVTTDVSGQADFIVNLPEALVVGSNITATTTDAGGNTSELSADFTVGNDSTPPVATIAPLPPIAASKTITLNLAADDPAGPAPEVASGVGEIELFVATDAGPFVSLGVVSGDTTTFDFFAQSGHSYAFYSLARDRVGNAESVPPSGVSIEVGTYVPDLDPPTASIDSIDATGPVVAINVSAVDAGGSGVDHIELLVSIDDAPVQLIDTVPSLNVVKYQAIRDGQSHRYDFFAVAIDRRGNRQPLSPLGQPDASVTAIFETPTTTEIVSFDVAGGLTQRSYIRNLELLLNRADSVDAILANGVSLTRFGTDGGGIGVPIDLSGIATAEGNRIGIDFGSSGIGGNPRGTTGDGVYQLNVDLDGDSVVDEVFRFFRLFGDADGNGVVESADAQRIQTILATDRGNLDGDINGDGRVDIRDRTDSLRNRGNSISNL